MRFGVVGVRYVILGWIIGDMNGLVVFGLSEYIVGMFIILVVVFVVNVFIIYLFNLGIVDLFIFLMV